MFRKIKLESLDVYRDGGSLSASYVDRKGTLNVLMFPIDIFASEERTKRVYLEPRLEMYLSMKVISPVTGIPRTETEKEEIRITWDAAKKTLVKLESQVNNIESDYKWVFDEMRIIANCETHEIEHS